MFGTNWPVDVLFAPYIEQVDAYRTIIAEAGFSPDEQARPALPERGALLPDLRGRVGTADTQDLDQGVGETGVLADVVVALRRDANEALRSASSGLAVRHRAGRASR